MKAASTTGVAPGVTAFGVAGPPKISATHMTTNNAPSNPTIAQRFFCSISKVYTPAHRSLLVINSINQPAAATSFTSGAHHPRAVPDWTYPINVSQAYGGACRIRNFFGRNGNSVMPDIFCHHKMRRGVGALPVQYKPMPLAERVGLHALVCAYLLPCLVEHFARHQCELAAQHIVHRNRTEEAEALAVFARGVRQAETQRKRADLGLAQMPDGKHCFTQRGFTDRPEKIGLVFVFIRAGKQLPVFNLSVMSRCHIVGPVRYAPIKKETELNFAVAKRIGVGRPPFFKFFYGDFKNLFLIFLRQVKLFKRDAQMRRHAHGVEFVLSRRTRVPLDSNAYKNAGHLIPLLLQQRRTHRRVHPAGKPDKHPALSRGIWLC